MCKTLNRVCRECGLAYQAKKAASTFCATACRMAFNNRRRDRGAEIYDLFMATRFDRKDAGEARAWALMCSLASAYRDADKATRGGRESWRDLDEAVAAIPNGFSKNGGDGR